MNASSRERKGVPGEILESQLFCNVTKYNIYFQPGLPDKLKRKAENRKLLKLLLNSCRVVLCVLCARGVQHSPACDITQDKKRDHNVMYDREDQNRTDYIKLNRRS